MLLFLLYIHYIVISEVSGVEIWTILLQKLNESSIKLMYSSLATQAQMKPVYFWCI